jgi:hypothetical protein
LDSGPVGAGRFGRSWLLETGSRRSVGNPNRQLGHVKGVCTRYFPVEPVQKSGSFYNA